MINSFQNYCLEFGGINIRPEIFNIPNGFNAILHKPTLGDAQASLSVGGERQHPQRFPGLTSAYLSANFDSYRMIFGANKKRKEGELYSSPTFLLYNTGRII